MRVTLPVLANAVIHGHMGGETRTEAVIRGKLICGDVGTLFDVLLNNSD